MIARPMSGRSLSSSFSRVLRERRLKLGLTQEDLAARAGIHRTHVGLLERARRSPTLDVAQALAEALQTTLSELVREAERR